MNYRHGKDFGKKSQLFCPNILIYEPNNAPKKTIWKVNSSIFFVKAFPFLCTCKTKQRIEFVKFAIWMLWPELEHIFSKNALSKMGQWKLFPCSSLTSSLVYHDELLSRYLSTRDVGGSARYPGCRYPFLGLSSNPFFGFRVGLSPISSQVPVSDLGEWRHLCHLFRWKKIWRVTFVTFGRMWRSRTRNIFFNLWHFWSHPSRKTSHFCPAGTKLFWMGRNVTIRLGLQHVFLFPSQICHLSRKRKTGKPFGLRLTLSMYE